MRAPLTAAAAAAAAASSPAQGAPASVGASLPHPPTGPPTRQPTRILVCFKQTPTAARIAAAQAASPLAGLRLSRLAGEHHKVVVRGQPNNGLASAASTSSSSLPSDAIFVYELTNTSKSSTAGTAGSEVGAGSGSGRMEAMLKQLRANPAVELAEPDFYHSFSTPPLGADPVLPNDTLYLPTSYSQGLWHLPQVGAPTAWATTVGSKETRVCIIDSGVRATHEDLRGSIAGGWNRAEDDEGKQPLPGTPAYSDLSDPDGHGSHTAGTLAAAGNNGVGVTGMAWNVSLYVCKASYQQLFSVSSLLDCYYLCRKEASAHVVSASYGGTGFSWFERDGIAKLGASGALFVAAAGNEEDNIDFRPMFPAAHNLDNIVAVAATSGGDEMATFSNFGKLSVHLAAPGVNILSSINTGDSAYDWYSGTSMATPLVAGAAALLKSAVPAATYAQIRSALLSSADQLPALSGWVASGGRLNVARALATLMGTPAPAPPPPVEYTWVVEQGQRYRMLDLRAMTVATSNASSNQECLDSCQGNPECFYVVAYGSTLVSHPRHLHPFNCLQMDKSVVVTSRESNVGMTSARRQALPQPPLPDMQPSASPPPPPPPLPPPPLGTFANPIPITELPFLSDEIRAYPLNVHPLPFCPLARDHSVVFHWYSGDTPPAGTLIAGSCDYTWGDPVVSALSSSNMTGGAFTCVDGNDDDDSCLANTPSTIRAFGLTIQVEPSTHYWLLAAPFKPSGNTFIRLNADFLAGPPSPSPPPPAFPPAPPLLSPPPAPPLVEGSWGNPFSIRSLPFTSQNVTAFITGAAPVACSMARGRSVIFRWFSEDSPGGLLTATNCGTSSGDSVVAVLSSANPTGGPFVCEGESDDDDGCLSNSRSVGAFGLSLPFRPQTYYFFAVAPFSVVNLPTLRFNVTSVPYSPPPPPCRPPPPSPSPPPPSPSPPPPPSPSPLPPPSPPAQPPPNPSPPPPPSPSPFPPPPTPSPPSPSPPPPPAPFPPPPIPSVRPSPPPPFRRTQPPVPTRPAPLPPLRRRPN